MLGTLAPHTPGGYGAFPYILGVDCVRLAEARMLALELDEAQELSQSARSWSTAVPMFPYVDLMKFW